MAQFYKMTLYVCDLGNENVQDQQPSQLNFGVAYTGNIVDKIVSLSEKYIYDRNRPDKCIDILDEVSKKLPGFPIVLHGSSSVPQEYVKMVNENGGKMPNAIGVPESQLRKAAELSVCKINIDSDLRLAMTGTIRKFYNDHPDKFDPREYLKPARANIKEIVRHKLINVLGSAGKAL